MSAPWGVPPPSDDDSLLLQEEAGEESEEGEDSLDEVPAIPSGHGISLADLLGRARSSIAATAKPGKGFGADIASIVRAQWTPRASIGIIRRTVCAHCSTASDAFGGWFTEYSHITDPHARRLVAERPSGALPTRSEVQIAPPADACMACLDTQMLQLDRRTA